MQTVTIIIGLTLSILGFICVRWRTIHREKRLWGSITRTVLPGAVLGAVVAVLALFPVTAADLVSCILLGILSGEIIYLFCLIARSTWERKEVITYYDDGSAPKFYITGDKHRDFAYVKKFCGDMNTRKKDVLIVLGDAGFNYFGDARDDGLKKGVSALNITLFCLHGNKECRPQNIGTYGVRSFCGGRVYYEPKYPNIFFAIDGEIYTFEGKKYMVVGGAHSVDKIRCLEENLPYWEDEMPDQETKAKVEERLAKENNDIYGMMTHTCPIQYLPTEMFISTRQKAGKNKKSRVSQPKKTFQPDIDRSTEEWLGKLEQQVDYKVWFCGHYHIDKQIDKVSMMYNEIRPLHMWEC